MGHRDSAVDLTVVKVPLNPELARLIDRARAAVEHDRATLDPWTRYLVERLDGALEEALTAALLGVPSDDALNVPTA